MQRVLTLRRRVRHGEARARAALELDQHGRRVLDLTFEHDVRREPGDPPRRSEEIEQHLESMAAEVHHRPAAGARAIEQPAPRTVGGRSERLERLHLGEDGHSDAA